MFCGRSVSLTLELKSPRCVECPGALSKRSKILKETPLTSQYFSTSGMKQHLNQSLNRNIVIHPLWFDQKCMGRMALLMPLNARGFPEWYISSGFNP
jgi:hypothetical protein